MKKILRIPCGNGNCYLVSNGENSILVDTCREKYRQKILDACKPFRVRLLVLTHGHLDHIQNAAFLSQELGCPVAMHRADLELLTDNLKQSLSAHTILGKLLLSVSIKSLQTDQIPIFSPSISPNPCLISLVPAPHVYFHPQNLLCFPFPGRSFTR